MPVSVERNPSLPPRWPPQPYPTGVRAGFRPPAPLSSSRHMRSRPRSQPFGAMCGLTSAARVIGVKLTVSPVAASLSVGEAPAWSSARAAARTGFEATLSETAPDVRYSRPNVVIRMQYVVICTYFFGDCGEIKPSSGAAAVGSRCRSSGGAPHFRCRRRERRRSICSSGRWIAWLPRGGPLDPIDIFGRTPNLSKRRFPQFRGAGRYPMESPEVLPGAGMAIRLNSSSPERATRRGRPRRTGLCGEASIEIEVVSKG
jgi:hypothetical protein